jgi:D-glycero-alpha-D-manno-heptose-7-phosphate kinase
MMHEGWLMKKSLTEGISSSLIDNFYEEARKSGAWGGKVLGAGGGGCILMLVPPEKHKSVREKMLFIAKENNLNGFQEIPVKFVQSGAEVLLNDTQGNDYCSLLSGH